MGMLSPGPGPLHALPGAARYADYGLGVAGDLLAWSVPAGPAFTFSGVVDFLASDADLHVVADFNDGTDQNKFLVFRYIDSVILRVIKAGVSTDIGTVYYPGARTVTWAISRSEAGVWIGVVDGVHLGTVTVAGLPTLNALRLGAWRTGTYPLNGVVRRVALTPTPLAEGVLVLNDYRMQMPAGASYARSGAASGEASRGVVVLFAADAPQRTDRGLALEPAATNILLRSADFGNAAWVDNSGGTGTGTCVLTGSTVAGPDGSMTGGTVVMSARSAVTREQSRAQFATVSAVAYTQQLRIRANGAGDVGKTVQTWQGNGITAINVVNVVLTAAWQRVHPASPVTQVAGSRPPLIFGRLPQSLGGLSDLTAVSFDVALADAKTGSVPTSYIPTTTAAATRGLPSYTEPVPTGYTRALLTFANATTLSVTGLTPGGTFDLASAVIGAGKGIAGVSELVTREWQS